MSSETSGCWALLFSCFYVSLGISPPVFFIYRSTPQHLTGMYCLFTVVDQGAGAGMCFIEVLKILMYEG